jgi:uncharacterized damage-inducible protein DinB
MADPTTPLPPEGKAAGGDEESVLLGYLKYHRIVLARKAEGITEEQARAALCPPSDFTMLGLIRHMTDVERGWFRRGLANEDLPPMYYGESHPDGDEDGDFHPPPDATMSDALTAYWAEIERCDENIAAHSLDHVRSPEESHNTLRRVIVHMIEEYARHCGHADLLRQAIDGVTGD